MVAFEYVVVGGTIALLCLVTAVRVAQIIRSAIDRYTVTNYVAFRTGLTVTELRKMLEARRLQAHDNIFSSQR